MKPVLLAFLLTAAALLPDQTEGAMDHSFLYFPTRPLEASPSDVGLAYEDVFFPAADGTLLHGWILPGEADAPRILFLHGNAGNISHRVENLYLLRRRLGASVFIFDYRGYGRSEGRASEEGTYADARGALAWLEKRGWAPGRMIFFGRSLGAAVATQMALEKAPAGLVLESPFPSVAAMGRHHYPILYPLLGWAMQAQYDTRAKLPRVRAPLLIIQGDRDAIVPEEMARQLFAVANEPKTFHLISGAGHNDTYVAGGPTYWETWRHFLLSLDKKAGAP